MTEPMWEPLVDLILNFQNSKDNVYVLCSRAFFRGRYKEDRLVPDATVSCEEAEQELSNPQNIAESPPMHIKNLSATRDCFESPSIDVAMTKKIEGENVSCYCSASHYSTDDYESVMASAREVVPCPLQNSDSGADLSEHFLENPTPQQIVNPQTDLNESVVGSSEIACNSILRDVIMDSAWEKHWATNGESIIWKSWISRYGAYVDPAYFDQQRDIPTVQVDEPSDECTIKKNESLESTDDFADDNNVTDHVKSNSFGNASGYSEMRSCNKLSDDCRRVRSRCSNITTDSMTNVTKITLSSLDLSCESNNEKSSSSLSTSSSSPLSSSSSSSKEDICNDADGLWRRIWKDHYDELYFSSYTSFVREYDASDSKDQTKENRSQVGESKLSKTEWNLKNKDLLSLTKENKPRSRHQILKIQQSSVGYLVEELRRVSLSDFAHSAESQETVDADTNESSDQAGDQAREQTKTTINTSSSTNNTNTSKSSCGSYNNANDDENNDDREKPKEKSSRKRRHESAKPRKNYLEQVKNAMQLLGVPFQPENDSNNWQINNGRVLFHKRNIRYQNRKLKFPSTSSQRPHIWFDDDVDHVRSSTKTQDDGSVAQLSKIPATNKPSHFWFDDDGNIIYERPKTEEVQGNEEEHKISLTELKGTDDWPPPESEALGYEAHSSSAEECNQEIDFDGCRKQKKKRRKQKFLNKNYPPEIIENHDMLKGFWHRRYQLFNRYDEGIQLDTESWFSVTPEEIAQHQAERCRCDVIIDAFCGAGGNSIQFARTCEKVISVDIDPKKIELAKHNAEIYGVADRIEFIVGDFLQLAPTLQADVIFLSPPWGGPSYKYQEVFSICDLLPPVGGKQLYESALKVTNNFAFFLPRNINAYEISKLSESSGGIEIEQNFLDSKIVGITAYFGDLIRDPSDHYDSQH